MRLAKIQSVAQLMTMVLDLVDEDLSIFRQLGRAINPFATSVVYQSEQPGVNLFYNVSDMLRLGVGDCEDLAAWLIAFFRWMGFSARPLLLRQNKTLWHVSTEVCLSGTWVEVDPSKMKGMRY